MGFLWVVPYPKFTARAPHGRFKTLGTTYGASQCRSRNSRILNLLNRSQLILLTVPSVPKVDTKFGLINCQNVKRDFDKC